MSKNKYALIREMLGDNISELIAEDLKETYGELLKELNQTINDEFKAPMFSYEKEVEIQELKKLLSAVKTTHSYYSCESLPDFDSISKSKTKKKKVYLVDHKCPICSAPASIEQPQESLHAYTTVYDCGTEITKAFGTDDEGIFDKRCDTNEDFPITLKGLKQITNLSSIYSFSIDSNKIYYFFRVFDEEEDDVITINDYNRLMKDNK